MTADERGVVGRSSMLLHQFSPHAAAGFELVANADTPEQGGNAAQARLRMFKAPL
jgi:hypothetical protein